ncbi:hypothetical protein ACFWWA_07475 [Streptomyces goshikiensis]
MPVDPTDPDTFEDHFREVRDADAPEVADGDAADQARVVMLDEDDYR